MDRTWYNDRAYCVRCHRDTLPTQLLCKRTEITDNGPDATDLDARYEGLCLRCCTHNHG